MRAYIPDIKEEKVAPLDARGFVLVSLALAGLVSGFSALGRGLLPIPIMAAAIGAGAVCGALYLVHARRKADPIVDLSLLGIRTFSASI